MAGKSILVEPLVPQRLGLSQKKISHFLSKQFNSPTNCQKPIASFISWLIETEAKINGA